MYNYYDYPKQDLIYEMQKLERENEQLKQENRDYRDQIYSLKFRIEQELEPRIKAERRAYDSWVSSPGE